MAGPTVPRGRVCFCRQRVYGDEQALCAACEPRTRETASLPGSFAHAECLRFVERQNIATGRKRDGRVHGPSWPGLSLQAARLRGRAGVVLHTELLSFVEQRCVETVQTMALLWRVKADDLLPVLLAGQPPTALLQVLDRNSEATRPVKAWGPGPMDCRLRLSYDVWHEIELKRKTNRDPGG